MRLAVILTPLLLPCTTGDCCKVGAWLAALDSSIQLDERSLYNQVVHLWFS